MSGNFFVHSPLALFDETALKPDFRCQKSLKNLKRPPDGPSWAQDGPSWAQVGPQMGTCFSLSWLKKLSSHQDGPKMAPRGPQEAPRWPKLGPRWPKLAPRWPQVGPKRLQDCQKISRQSNLTAMCMSISGSIPLKIHVGFLV